MREIFQDVQAYPTFPGPRGSEYHRVRALSRLCSEWEEVEHARIKHRHVSEELRNGGKKINKKTISRDSLLMKNA